MRYHARKLVQLEHFEGRKNLHEAHGPRQTLCPIRLRSSPLRKCVNDNCRRVALQECCNFTARSSLVSGQVTQADISGIRQFALASVAQLLSFAHLADMRMVQPVPPGHTGASWILPLKFAGPRRVCMQREHMSHCNPCINCIIYSIPEIAFPAPPLCTPFCHTRRGQWRRQGGDDVIDTCCTPSGPHSCKYHVMEARVSQLNA